MSLQRTWFADGSSFSLTYEWLHEFSGILNIGCPLTQFKYFPGLVCTINWLSAPTPKAKTK